MTVSSVPEETRPVTHTANEQLARIIIDALIDEGLVLPGRGRELAERLAEGRVTPEDWWRWIEEALPEEVEG